MKALLQRVKKASVTIDGNLYSKIEEGILVFLGVEKGDSNEQAEFLAHKICELRIFDDEFNKMNLSIKDIDGKILVVSQFTLAADCRKGRRPNFDNAEKPEKAQEIYEKFVSFIKEPGIKTQTGKFGAMMDIELTNNGPVTFVLTKNNKLL